MKSLTALCPATAAAPLHAVNPSGRAIARHHHQQPQRENAEMKMYLSKLRDLVPFMPKNRKLSKLEIIQHVIDYICDLQTELETHPDIGSFDAASALNFVASSQSAAAIDDMEADDIDEDEDLERETEAEADDADDDALTQRLSAEASAEAASAQRHQQQRRQSSPAAVRQPLADRQAPNTILPAAGAAPTPQQLAAARMTSTSQSVGGDASSSRAE